MVRAQNPSLEILSMAVDHLGELTTELVFLGGCATGLLITDAAAPPIRVTRDVDAVVQVAALGDYHRFAARLRAKGFSEDDSDGAPICRWKSSRLILDVMPTDEKILGFGNRWYAEAALNAVAVKIATGAIIRSVSGPYFLITKLEAFNGRGGGDYLMSHDIEDVVAVVDGRPELVNEVRQASPGLKRELAGRMQQLLSSTAFMDDVAGHMPTDAASQARVPAAIGALRSSIKSADSPFANRPKVPDRAWRRADWCAVCLLRNCTDWNSSPFLLGSIVATGTTSALN